MRASPRRNPWRTAVWLLALLTAACGGRGAPERPQLLVFAAASLRDVAADLAAEFERREGAEVVFNFAGSNTLAQQIDAAPRADVFLSADGRWVDFLDAAGRTVPGSRRSFLSNRLVIIARRDAGFELGGPGELATAGFRYLALADPSAVPAGRYARAALEGIAGDGGTLWDAVAERVVPALDVRAALALVESDPKIVGIVYRTDALTSTRVRVLRELPLPAEAPITYWGTRIAGGAAPELGARFLDFLASPEARATAERHGFTLPDR